MGEQRTIVLCLGNPGAAYAKTRHNAGFFVADCLASLLGIRFRRPWFTSYSLAEYQSLVLVKPRTYMNRSGDVLSSVCRKLGIHGYTLLVVFDQMDLPPGSVRLKRGGGDGGHRGLRSVFAQAKTDSVWKLAIGIGRPASGVSVVDHVLSVPDPESEEQIQNAVTAASNVVRRLCTSTPEELMNEVNRRS